MKKYLGLLALYAIVLSGCSLPVESYTMLTTRNMDPHIPISEGKIIKDVTATEWRSVWILALFSYTPIDEPPRIEAINKALQSVDAEMFMNVKVYRTWWWIPFIYGQEYVTIEGDAVVFDKKEHKK